MSSNRVVVACVLAITAAACASGGSAASSASTASASSDLAAAPARRDPNVITKAELADPALRALTVYDAIVSLRPRFLNAGGTHSITNTGAGSVHASIDNGGVVAIDDLKQIQAITVLEIRFLPAAAAMQRFGARANEGPVIVVRTM